MGPDAMILVFWMLSFKPTSSLSSSTFITRLFGSSLFSAVRVLSSAYLSLLIFSPTILIPACASSTPRLYSSWDSLGQNTGVEPFPSPGGSSQSRDQTQVSCTAGGFSNSWATREALLPIREEEIKEEENKEG